MALIVGVNVEAADEGIERGGAALPLSLDESIAALLPEAAQRASLADRHDAILIDFCAALRRGREVATGCFVKAGVQLKRASEAPPVAHVIPHIDIDDARSRGAPQHRVRAALASLQVVRRHEKLASPATLSHQCGPPWFRQCLAKAVSMFCWVLRAMARPSPAMPNLVLGG